MEAHVAMANGTTEYFWGHFEHYHPVLNDDIKLGLFFSLCTFLATCVPIVIFWLCFAVSHLADLLRGGEKEFDEEKEIGPGEERPLLGACKHSSLFISRFPLVLSSRVDLGSSDLVCWGFPRFISKPRSCHFFSPCAAPPCEREHELTILAADDFREDYGTTGTHIIRIAEPRTIRTVDGHDIYYISEMSW